MSPLSGPPPPPSARGWLAVSIASGLAAIATIAALTVFLSRPGPPQQHTAIARIAIVETETTELRGSLYEQTVSEATRNALVMLRSRPFAEQVARGSGLDGPES